MIGIYEKNSSENLEFNANVFFKLFCSVQICWVEWVELGRVPTLRNRFSLLKIKNLHNYIKVFTANFYFKLIKIEKQLQ